MRGRFQKVKDIVEEVSKHSCNNLIDLTTEDEGYNMLHFAVCNKHPEIVQYLIESGASKEAMCCSHHVVHMSITMSLDSIMGNTVIVDVGF